MSLLTAEASTFVFAQSPSVDIVAKLREHVVRLQADLPSIVARERYQQTASYSSHRIPPVSRTLISELVMVKLPGEGGWVSFRDVLEVDGRKLDDHQRRLVDLLQTPSPNTLQQARQLAAESARYNVGEVARTINVPDIALEYLSARHADRISFTQPEHARVAGRETAALRFREHKGPSILRNSEGRDLLVGGRVWVEPESGALVRTELIVRDRNSSASCIVDFVVDEKLRATVPSKMTERYSIPGATIDAVANYSDYRRFGVSTNEKIIKPPPVR